MLTIIATVDVPIFRLREKGIRQAEEVKRQLEGIEFAEVIFFPIAARIHNSVFGFREGCD